MDLSGKRCMKGRPSWRSWDLWGRSVLCLCRYNGNDGELDAALQDYNALQAARRQHLSAGGAAACSDEEGSDSAAAPSRRRGRRRSAVPPGGATGQRRAARQRRTTIAPGQVGAGSCPAPPAPFPLSFHPYTLPHPVNHVVPFRMSMDLPAGQLGHGIRRVAMLESFQVSRQGHVMLLCLCFVIAPARIGMGLGQLAHPPARHKDHAPGGNEFPCFMGFVNPVGACMPGVEA